MAAMQGDWHVTTRGDEGPRYVHARQTDGEEFIVAKVWAIDDDEDYESTARLVAAAPDLYAVCKLLFGCLGEVIEEHNEVAYSDLRMALMKAEGET